MEYKLPTSNMVVRSPYLDFINSPQEVRLQ